MTQRKSAKERERDREKENDIERRKERERERERERMVGEIKMNFSTEQMRTGEIENLLD